MTFSGNTAFSGGAMPADSSASISNSIFWGDSPNEMSVSQGSPPTINDSVVQSDCPPKSICTNVLTGDPKLGPLQDNSGFTQTHALLLGSAAIDEGNDATCAASDQRGIHCPQGTHRDIGAYEIVRSTQYTIAGIVGIADGAVSYVDATLKTAIANSAGVYSFTVSAGWSGTVTPSKTGYVFVPVSRSGAAGPRRACVLDLHEAFPGRTR